jgi:hypothetical protein
MNLPAHQGAGNRKACGGLKSGISSRIADRPNSAGP